MYRSEQRAVASTCLEIAEEAKGSTIIRKVSAYLFCLFYLLFLNLLFVIYLLHPYVCMHLVCIMDVCICTLLLLLACDVWGIWFNQVRGPIGRSPSKGLVPGVWRERGMGGPYIYIIYMGSPHVPHVSCDPPRGAKYETVRLCPLVRRDTAIKWNVGISRETPVSLGKRGPFSSGEKPFHPPGLDPKHSKPRTKRSVLLTKLFLSRLFFQKYFSI